ncbi:hypothetical protein [Quatrionicoccus australiensis]|uniref:hypothetical protein n=1 Tax=Quatrionicoccus australiensis TaxID=138118 RepID=UPI001CFBDA80|nr:hypothetical protein [Quatrionicoccus australiensis]MCB4359605.1 hypothetical protein [Quatrionicoccus australiensis]
MQYQTATAITTNIKGYIAPKNHGIEDIETLFMQKRGVIETRLYKKYGIPQHALDDLLQDVMLFCIANFKPGRSMNLLSFALNFGVKAAVSNYYGDDITQHEFTVAHTADADDCNETRIETLDYTTDTPEDLLSAARFIEGVAGQLSGGNLDLFLATEGCDWHGLTLVEQEDLAKDMGLSIHQLQRRIKSLRAALEEIAPAYVSSDFKKKRNIVRKAAQAECRA